MRLVLFATLLLAAGTSLAAQPATVILVRHGERASTPGSDPLLSDAGTERALALRNALAHAGVSAIVVTQFQRTQLTAKPLADLLRVPLTIVRAGSPVTAHVDSVAAAVRSHRAGSTVLVVGHSNTVPGIIAALGGPKLPDLCDGEYASLFILTAGGADSARLIRAKYGASDAPDSGDCARTMRQ